VDLCTDCQFDSVSSTGFTICDITSSHSEIGLESLQHHWLGPSEQFNVVTPRAQQAPIVCPNCGKMYAWKRNLMRHLKLECDKKPQQKCPYCWFITKHKSVVKTHIYRKHKNMPNIP
jgi:uncharacterized Zn-finger protein